MAVKKIKSATTSGPSKRSAAYRAQVPKATRSYSGGANQNNPVKGVTTRKQATAQASNASKTNLRRGDRANLAPGDQTSGVSVGGKYNVLGSRSDRTYTGGRVSVSRGEQAFGAKGGKAVKNVNTSVSAGRTPAGLKKAAAAKKKGSR